MRNGRLFVYGTLRKRAGTEMAALLERHAKLEGEGFFRGRLYHVSDYPGVVPSADPRDRVQGDVYRLVDADALLSHLDEYEGCGPDDPEPTEYIRELQPIELPDGQTVRAWVYLYNRATRGLERIASGVFVASRRKRVSPSRPKLRTDRKRTRAK